MSVADKIIEVESICCRGRKVSNGNRGGFQEYSSTPSREHPLRIIEPGKTEDDATCFVLCRGRRKGNQRNRIDDTLSIRNRFLSILVQ